MNKVSLISRYLLGLLFLIFGLNGFFQFLPMPPPPESVMDFMKGIMSTGYFMPVLKGTEVFVSILLLTGLAAPVGLVILAPITIQILLFHGFLTPGIQNLGLPLVILVLHLLSAYQYKDLYIPLFSRK